MNDCTRREFVTKAAVGLGMACALPRAAWAKPAAAGERRGRPAPMGFHFLEERRRAQSFMGRQLR